MDSRTGADTQAGNDYTYFYRGGWSWSMPYIAWLYALAAQADPSITPHRFWELAMRTGAHNPDQARQKRVSAGPDRRPGSADCGPAEKVIPIEPESCFWPARCARQGPGRQAAPSG
jgi:hypothetical protein